MSILDTYPTRDTLLILPAHAPEGRWTMAVSVPLEGRSCNGGIRWEL